MSVFGGNWFGSANNRVAAARARNSGKPGELALCIGIVMLIVAPFVYYMMGETDRQHTQLLQDGVVAQAQVVGHDSRTESYTGRQGRPRTRTIHSIALRHDFNASTPYAEWKASGTLRPSAYPAMTSSTLDVAESWQDELPPGATTHVVWRQGDSASMRLVPQIEYELSARYHLWWYLGLAALFVGGAVLSVVGFKKRFGHG